MKIAVFGCGYWGNNHVRTLAELGVLAGVVDVNPEAAEITARKHNSIALTADEALSDPAIDAITMALPADMHAETAQKAFVAGKHVFAEKPIALSVADAQSMVDAAARANRILMAGHILRYHNAFREIMKLVENDTFGKIKYVQSHRLGFGKFHEKFDALWDLAPHDLSLLLSVVGHGPVSQHSMPVSVTDGQTDFAHVAFDFGDDLKGHIHVSRFSPYVERRFTVIGEKAMAVWDDMEPDWNKKVSLHRYSLAQAETGSTYIKEEPEFIACSQGMALTDELNLFVHCIKTGETPLTDGQQGLDVVKILNDVR